MVDNTNPTNQFHPYQPPDSTPVAERHGSGFGDLLKKIGLDTGKLPTSLQNTDLKGSVNKARDYAAANPGKVLGGLAALVIGAGLMRQRGMHRNMPRG